MTRYTLWASVENPYDLDGGRQDHWSDFRAANDDEARRIAALKLRAWTEDFGGWSDAQLRRNDIDGYVPSRSR